MSKKQEFINYVETIMSQTETPMNEEAIMFWNALCGFGENGEKPLFTDNGKLILKFLQENLDTPTWKSKDIAEGLFVSSRTVSGAIRKLVSDGYVEKLGTEPVIYAITDKGKNITID